MNPWTLSFLFPLISLSQSCSCLYKKSSEKFCELDDVIKVRVTKVLIDRPMAPHFKTEVAFIRINNNSTTPPGKTTTQPRTTSRNIVGKKEVEAEVLRTYRRNTPENSKVILTTAYMDSTCGMGNFINLNQTYILNGQMHNGKIHVGMCKFFFSSKTYIENMVENIDCSCSNKRCRLDLEKRGRSVFRRICKYEHSFCGRDENGVCVWGNVHNLKCCKIGCDIIPDES